MTYAIYFHVQTKHMQLFLVNIPTDEMFLILLQKCCISTFIFGEIICDSFDIV